MSDRPLWALRFISGKYQGGEFPLKPDQEIIIGRSSDLDMVLVEDMVSRKHAKISTFNNQVIFQDLGSTNGSFVNGEKIKRVRLREGDRILVGTSIIKLVSLDPNAVSQSSENIDFSGGEPAKPAVTGSHSVPPVAQVNKTIIGGENFSSNSMPKRTQTSSGRTMSGTIDEIPLPDLLQLLSTSKKSGVLEVIQPNGETGRMYLRKGQIYYAIIGDDETLGPEKSIYRILTWVSGTFELHPPVDTKFEVELNDSTEALLMEAMRRLDEIKRFEEDVPSPEAAVSLAKPLKKALRELSPDELDLVQLVHNYGQVKSIVDNSSSPDLDTYERLAKLARDGIVVIESDAI